MTRIDIGLFEKLTPQALEINRTACHHANEVLIGFGILKNAKRVIHFWAQVLHESGGLSRLVENLNYSAPRLMQVWPARFPTFVEASKYAGQPQALANKVYGGRMGNVLPDDGWRYIGRGLLQLTGRYNYTRIGDSLGLNLVDNPNLVLLPEYALAISAEVWRQAGCNELADKDSIIEVTRAINGGLNGLEDRKRWLTKVKNIVMTEE